MSADLFESGGAEARNANEGLTRHRVRGEILRVVFASADGAYAVLRLRDEHGHEITLVGPLGGIMEGQDIEAEGHWETHKDHGRQLRVDSYRAILPSTEEGTRRYLASGLIPGIGPKFAERIVEHFGPETLTVLDRYSSRLTEVPGIGRKRAEEIRKAWREHSEQREIAIFLQGLGISAAYCARIIQRYGVAAAEVVRRNPYQLAAEVRGIGFLSADRIASKLGVDADHPLRLAAGTEYVLDQLAQQGHVCYPEKELLDETARILDVPPEKAEAGLVGAKRNGRVVRDTESRDGTSRIYLRRLHQAEVDLAEILRILGGTTPPRHHAGGIPRRHLEHLNQEQREAVITAFRSSVSIITGGPGVGKTTVVGQIVAVAKHCGLKTLLAAPTGRAAKRMSETTGAKAMTIHRLLQWDAAEGVFSHDPDNPLSCDLLIVDEVSMLDVVLAAHLFRAVQPGTRVVLVGDKDQLPSVGPGTVLQDLIFSGRLPVTDLIRIYRQEAHSRIITNAHAVNRGSMPDLRPAPANARADFYWIEQEDPERVAETIARMVAERIPQRFGFHPLADIQVLAPMHRGSCGTITLNERLQSALNPGGHGPEFGVGERRFRVNDRVMQTVNNYDKGVFNGELGSIREIDGKKKTLTIDFDIGRVEYDWADVDQILHAYAITVHKSQGSEFPVVIMPLLTQHYVMLQRNLVYTGMTRAQKLLIMIGTRRALGLALRNNTPMMRHTRLAERLAAPREESSLFPADPPPG